MTKEDVQSIMGTQTCEDAFVNIIGQKHLFATGTNPYRIESHRIEGGRFEVIYYWTDVKSADAAVSDDELTPIVLENGKVVGWGQDFLQEEVKRYELRLR
jgi:hypothetical protein